MSDNQQDHQINDINSSSFGMVETEGGFNDYLNDFAESGDARLETINESDNENDVEKSEIENLKEQLALKDEEIANLKISYDTYAESSKELETEIEAALHAAEEKLAEQTKLKNAATERAEQFKSKLNTLSKDYESITSELKQTKDKESAAIFQKRTLEIANEDLLNKVRIAHTTEEDLKHELTKREESLILLQGDFSELKLSFEFREKTLKSELDLLKKSKNMELRSEIEASLRKEFEEKLENLKNQDPNQLNLKLNPEDEILPEGESVSNSSVEHSPFGTPTSSAKIIASPTSTSSKKMSADEGIKEIMGMPKARTPMSEDTAMTRRKHLDLMEKAKAGMQVLIERIAELEAKNIELSDHLQKSEDEYINFENSKNTEMSKIIAQKEADYDIVLRQKNLMQERLEQLKEPLIALEEKEAEISVLRNEFENYKETSIQEKVDLVREMSEKIEKLSKELNDTKSATISDLITGKIDNNENTRKFDENSRKQSLLLAKKSIKNLLQMTEKTHGETTLQSLVFNATNSGDVETMQDALNHMVEQLELMRNRNAELLVRLQAMRHSITVYCRVRPALDEEVGRFGRICVDAAHDGSPEMLCYDSRMESWKSFLFDGTFDAMASQADVFFEVAPMVPAVLEGKSICIMAYGQTGSGKTFTMSGEGTKKGINYSVIQKLLELLEIRRLAAQKQQNQFRKIQKENNKKQKGKIAEAVSRGNSRANLKSSENNQDDEDNNRTNKTGNQSFVKKSSFFEFSNPLQKKKNKAGQNDSLSKMALTPLLRSTSLAAASEAAAIAAVTAATLAGVEPEMPADSPFSIDALDKDPIGGVDVTVADEYDEDEDDHDAKKDEDDDETDDDDDDKEVFVYEVELTILEIYNEQVYDLLSYQSNPTETPETENETENENKTEKVDKSIVEVKQDPEGNITVIGNKRVKFSNILEATDVLESANENRKKKWKNDFEEHCSCSSLVIIIDVMTCKENEPPVRGKIHLVDLPGSERAKKKAPANPTPNKIITNSQPVESQVVSTGLNTLAKVMEALEQKRRIIAYKESKLTFLLQNSLGKGNSLTTLIVTVCPTDLTLDETYATFQMATRARKISLGEGVSHAQAKNLENNIKKLNTELEKVQSTKGELENEITNLKKEQRKAADRSSSLVEAKLKGIEEAKRAAEVLMIQLNKQISETNNKYRVERDLKEQISVDLELTQRNLKRALDQVKEHAREKEKILLTLKKKDKELESLRTQTLRHSTPATPPLLPPSPVNHSNSVQRDSSHPNHAVTLLTNNGLNSDGTYNDNPVNPNSPILKSGARETITPSSNNLNNLNYPSPHVTSPENSPLKQENLESSPKPSLTPKNSGKELTRIPSYMQNTASRSNAIINFKEEGTPLSATKSSFRKSSSNDLNDSSNHTPFNTSTTTVETTKNTPKTKKTAPSSNSSVKSRASSGGVKKGLATGKSKLKKNVKDDVSVDSKLSMNSSSTVGSKLSLRSEDAIKKHQERLEKKRQAALDKKRREMLI